MDAGSFKEFKHSAIHALSQLNGKREAEFKVSSWPRWDYELEKGTLSFSKDGIPQVIASIQVVGTTHNPSNTWLWGWANQSFPERAKFLMDQVRRFGETEDIHQLTESSLPNDEYLGWEMTAIAAQVLSAKGAYRCPLENGFLYCVYTGIWFASDPLAKTSILNQARDEIECANHGKGITTFICEHLCTDPRQKWFSSPPDETNLWPDAWCEKCNIIFKEQGEWNDKNSKQMNAKLLCHRCYEAVRSLGTPE